MGRGWERRWDWVGNMERSQTVILTWAGERLLPRARCRLFSLTDIFKDFFLKIYCVLWNLVFPKELHKIQDTVSYSLCCFDAEVHVEILTRFFILTIQFPSPERMLMKMNLFKDISSRPWACLVWTWHLSFVFLHTYLAVSPWGLTRNFFAHSFLRPYERALVSGCHIRISEIKKILVSL